MWWEKAGEWRKILSLLLMACDCINFPKGHRNLYLYYRKYYFFNWFLRHVFLCIKILSFSLLLNYWWAGCFLNKFIINWRAWGNNYKVVTRSRIFSQSSMTIIPLLETRGFAKDFAKWIMEKKRVKFLKVKGMWGVSNSICFLEESV